MLCLVFVFSCSSPSSLCVVSCCVCLVPLPRAVPLCLVSCFFVLVFVCFFGRSFVRCFVCLVRVCLFVVLVVGLGWVGFVLVVCFWCGLFPLLPPVWLSVCVCVFVPGFRAALHACFTRLPCMIYVLDSFHASFPPLGGFPFFPRSAAPALPPVGCLFRCLASPRGFRGPCLRLPPSFPCCPRYFVFWFRRLAVCSLPFPFAS